MKALPQTLNGRRSWVLLVALTLLAALAWLGLGGAAPRLTAARLYHSLGSPLLWLLVYLGVGLLVGQAIESLGWAARLGSWAAPLLGWGHLPRESGASFTAAFFSKLLAYTMLWTFYQEGKLSRREMTLTYLFNGGLPVFLLHLPTTFFIILPLTREAGLIYLGLIGGAALLLSQGLRLLSLVLVAVPYAWWGQAGESARPRLAVPQAAGLQGYWPQPDL